MKVFEFIKKCNKAKGKIVSKLTFWAGKLKEWLNVKKKRV